MRVQNPTWYGQSVNMGAMPMGIMPIYPAGQVSPPPTTITMPSALPFDYTTSNFWWGLGVGALAVWLLKK